MIVGIGRTDITPKESVYLCGHAIRTEKSEGILDPLYCTSMILKQNDVSVCFINYDLIMLDSDMSMQIRSMIAERLCCPISHVFTIVTHTHAGPELDENSVFGLGKNRVQVGYRDIILNETLKSFELAESNLESVTMRFGKVDIDGYYGNRNNKEYQSDKSFNIIEFLSDKKCIGGIINLSCHPTVLGPQNLKVSADLFGAIRNGIEEINGVKYLMTNGAQGDVSNRQYREGNDEVELDRVSKGILSQVIEKIELSEVFVDSIDVKEFKFAFESELDHDRYKKEIEETKITLLRNDLPFDQRKVLSSGIAVLNEKLKMTERKLITLDTYIVSIGGITIFTIPGELFSKFGIQIKKRIGSKALIFGLTNYSNGYLIDLNEYGKNYESMTTLIPKGTIEKYIDELVSFALKQKSSN